MTNEPNKNVSVGKHISPKHVFRQFHVEKSFFSYEVATDLVYLTWKKIWKINIFRFFFRKNFQVLTSKTVKNFSMGNRLKRAEKVFLQNEKSGRGLIFRNFFSRQFLVRIG
jgi:hypothetical protein